MTVFDPLAPIRPNPFGELPLAPTPPQLPTDDEIRDPVTRVPDRVVPLDRVRSVLDERPGLHAGCVDAGTYADCRASLAAANRDNARHINERDVALGRVNVLLAAIRQAVTDLRRPEVDRRRVAAALDRVARETVTPAPGSLEDLAAARVRSLLATCPACTDRSEREQVARRNVPGLTEHRLRVLALLVDGLSADQIATRLQITASTVKSHVLALHRAFRVDNRAALVAKALRSGVIS